MVDYKAIMIITILAVVESLQLTFIIAHVYSFIPIVVEGAQLPGLEPERESFLYIIFLVLSVIFAIGLTWILNKPLTSEHFRRTCIRFIGFELFWLCLMFVAFFKWVTYQYPFYNILPLENSRWVLPFFYAVLGGSVLTKIFWPEVNRHWDTLLKWVGNVRLKERNTGVMYGAMIGCIVLVLYPNVDMTLAIVNQWSQFANWQDFAFTKFLMGRGFLAGQILLIVFFMNVFFLSVLLIAAHRFLKSFWLALIVILLTIRMTFFHYGMSPICWNYPGDTLINFGFNLGFYQDANHVPMYAALRVRQFFSFFMGYGIVILYVFTLLNTWGKNRVAVILSIVGLLLHTRYMAHAEVFAYGAVCWPAIVLAVFWIKYISAKFFAKKALLIFIGLAILAFMALLTSRGFVVYPHFWTAHVNF